MRIRSFTATDMPAAMKMVREAMGEDAIILSSQQVGGKSISVTAAIDVDDEAPPSRPFERITSRDNVPDNLRFAVQDVLRFHNLPEFFIAKLLQKGQEGAFARANALLKQSGKTGEQHLSRLALEQLFAAYYHFDALTDSSLASRHIMLVGTPGIGKTLTAAKLVTRLSLARQPVAVITTDTQRAGGIEQLQAFTDILGIGLKVAATRTELWKELKSIPDGKTVIIDSAGCNPYHDEEWQRLQSFASIDSVEPVLVLPAGGDSAEAIDSTEIFMGLPIRRLVLTRTDTTRRFGAALAVAAAHDLAFAQLSTSSSLADSLFPADEARLAQLILRYQSSTA